MKASLSGRFGDLGKNLRGLLNGPQSLAFLPAIALGAFWLGGEAMLAAVSLGVPVLYMILARDALNVEQVERVASTGELITFAAAADLAQRAIDNAADGELSTACIMVEIVGLDEVERHHGEEEADSLRDLTLSRLRNTLRRDDIAARISDSRFAIVLGPSVRLDLEALLQLSSRLQAAVEEPATIAAASRFLSANIGFCGSTRLKQDATGERMVEAARMALADASLNGPSAIRAWSENMDAAHNAHKSLLAEVKRALNNGQIQPWFQPQVCTSTGAISGAEALARWIHPERGLVSPAQFLRSLEEAGQMSRLGEVILQHSLTALRSWDQAGIEVPRVSVNFSSTELQDPHLVERIRWELDRFGLNPCRLGVEVLETVIAKSPDGIVARNIEGLGQLGCQIDLDDFGTGHSSITSLRRFPVNRIKIDRSFVTRIDRDEDQRRMLAAVLGMADRLGLATLAEGVETVGEHALLAQLGCDHVQGFGIARPMPADQLVDWARNHTAKIAEAQRLGRSTG